MEGLSGGERAQARVLQAVLDSSAGGGRGASRAELCSALRGSMSAEEVEAALDEVLMEGLVLAADDADDRFVPVDEFVVRDFVGERSQARQGAPCPAGCAASTASTASTASAACPAQGRAAQCPAQGNAASPVAAAYTASFGYGYGSIAPPVAPSSSSSGNGFDGGDGGYGYGGGSPDGGTSNWRGEAFARRQVKQPAAKYKQAERPGAVVRYCERMESLWEGLRFKKEYGWVGGVVVNVGMPVRPANSFYDWSMGVSLVAGANAMRVTARIYASTPSRFPVIRKVGDLMFLSCVSAMPQWVDNNTARHFTTNMKRAEVVLVDRDSGPYPINSRARAPRPMTFSFRGTPAQDAVAALCSQAAVAADAAGVGSPSYVDPLTTVTSIRDFVALVDKRSVLVPAPDGSSLRRFAIQDNCEPPVRAFLYVAADCAQDFDHLLHGADTPWVRFQGVRLQAAEHVLERAFLFEKSSAAIVVYVPRGLYFQSFAEFLPFPDQAGGADHEQQVLEPARAAAAEASAGVPPAQVAAAGAGDAAAAAAAAAAPEAAAASPAQRAPTPPEADAARAAGTLAASSEVGRATAAAAKTPAGGCATAAAQPENDTLSPTISEREPESGSPGIPSIPFSSASSSSSSPPPSTTTTPPPKKRKPSGPERGLIASVLDSICGTSNASPEYVVYVRPGQFARCGRALTVSLQDDSGSCDAMTHNCASPTALFTLKPCSPTGYVRAVVRGVRVCSRDVLDVLHAQPVNDMAEVEGSPAPATLA